MVRCLLILIAYIYSASVFAQPDFSSYLDLGVKGYQEKIRVYRDHKNKKKWYVSPAQISIGGDQNPGYNLDLMRYKGRKGSGDAEKFWIKSVLHMEMEKIYGKAVLSEIRSLIKKEGHKITSLKHMPEQGSRFRVMLGDLDSKWSGYTKWSNKDIAIALSDHMAQILWDSAQKQQQLMSVEVQTKVVGVRPAKDESDKQDGKESKKDKWNEDSLIASQTIPLQLNSEQYPDRFRRIDLDANIDFGYTGLDVFCFDFLEGNYPDLYAVLVDVKIKTEDRELVKQLRFDDNSGYRYRIDFGIAKSLDEPYMIRLTYIDKDGNQRQEPWFKKHGELMLDVTRYH